jgi:hypothetical protein
VVVSSHGCVEVARDEEKKFDATRSDKYANDAGSMIYGRSQPVDSRANVRYR